MNKKLIILSTATILFSIIAFGEPPHKDDECAYIKLDPIEGHPVLWRDVNTLLGSVISMGYVCVDINGFKWHYYCDHCENIPLKQGHDELVLSSENMEIKSVEDWSQRNKGKYPVIAFGDGVELSIVKEVTDVFHKHGLKHFLSTFEEERNGVKIDLWNKEVKKLKEVPDKLDLGEMFKNLPPVPAPIAMEIFHLLEMEGISLPKEK